MRETSGPVEAVLVRNMAEATGKKHKAGNAGEISEAGHAGQVNDVGPVGEVSQTGASGGSAKIPGTGGPGDAAGAAELAAIRVEIDKTDDELLRLLNRRAGFVARVAALKEQMQVPFYVPSRERQIVERLSSANTGPFPFPKQTVA